MKRIVLLLFVVVALSSNAVFSQSIFSNNDANVAIQNGRYGDAISFLEKNKAVEPTWGTFYLLGRAYSAVENYDKALEYFLISLQKKCSTEQKQASVSNVSYVCFQLEKYDEAVKYATQVIRLDNKDVSSYATRAFAYIKLAEKEMGIADVNAFVLLGDFQMPDVGKTGAKYLRLAEQDLLRIIELKPQEDNGWTYDQLATVAFYQKDFKKLKTYSMKAVDAEDGCMMSYKWLFDIYADRKQMNDAADVVVKSLRKNDPFSYGLLSQFATTFGEDGENVLAPKLMIQCNRNSNDSKWYYHLASYYEYLENIMKCAKYDKIAYEKDVYNAKLASTTARAVYLSGDTNGALKYANRAIYLDENQDVAWYVKGMVEYYRRDYGAAAESMSKAVLLSPNDANLFFTRCRIYMKMKRYEEAVDDISVALSLRIYHEDSLWYLYNRGVCYQAMGNERLAEQDFKTIIQMTPEPKEGCNAVFAYLD